MSVPKSKAGFGCTVDCAEGFNALLHGLAPH